MASPYISAHRVDQAVQGFLADAGQDESVFIAPTLPTVEVGPENFSGILYTLPIETYLGDSTFVLGNGLKRAPKGTYPSPFGEHEANKTPYECEERSAKDFIDDVTASRFRFPLGAEQMRAAILRRTLLLNFEADLAANVIFNAGNWSNAAIGALPGGAGVAWSTLATSDPTRDGNAISDVIRGTSGVKPDYAVITYDVAQVLRRHPHTLGAITLGIGGSAVVGQTAAPLDAALALWADRWQLPNGIKVLSALYNSAAPLAAPTVASLATAQVWFGCSRGVTGGQQIEGGAVLGNGPASFVILREQMLRGYRWLSNDPPGAYIAGAHSYAVARPTDMAGTAYLVTGVV